VLHGEILGGLAHSPVLCPAYDRWRVVHFNVTEHPTAQQIVEAFPFDAAPSYLIRGGQLKESIFSALCRLIY